MHDTNGAAFVDNSDETEERMQATAEKMIAHLHGENLHEDIGTVVTVLAALITTVSESEEEAMMNVGYVVGFLADELRDRSWGTVQ